MVPLRRFAELLEEAEQLLQEARSFLGGAPDRSRPIGPEEGVLALYEALQSRLEGIDPKEVEKLLGRVKRVLDDLAMLERELERLKRLRAAGGNS